MAMGVLDSQRVGPRLQLDRTILAAGVGRLDSVAQTIGRAVGGRIRCGAKAACRTPRTSVQKQKHHDQRRRLEDAPHPWIPPCRPLDRHQLPRNNLIVFHGAHLQGCCYRINGQGRFNY